MPIFETPKKCDSAEISAPEAPAAPRRPIPKVARPLDPETSQEDSEPKRTRAAYEGYDGWWLPGASGAWNGLTADAEAPDRRKYKKQKSAEAPAAEAAEAPAAEAAEAPAVMRKYHGTEDEQAERAELDEPELEYKIGLNPEVSGASIDVTIGGVRVRFSAYKHDGRSTNFHRPM